MSEIQDRPQANAEAYIALMDVAYLSERLQVEDLHNHVSRSTYRQWWEAVQRANIALLQEHILRAD